MYKTNLPPLSDDMCVETFSHGLYPSGSNATKKMHEHMVQFPKEWDDIFNQFNSMVWIEDKDIMDKQSKTELVSTIMGRKNNDYHR